MLLSCQSVVKLAENVAARNPCSHHSECNECVDRAPPSIYIPSEDINITVSVQTAGIVCMQHIILNIQHSVLNMQYAAQHTEYAAHLQQPTAADSHRLAGLEPVARELGRSQATLGVPRCLEPEHTPSATTTTNDFPIIR